MCHGPNVSLTECSRHFCNHVTKMPNIVTWRKWKPRVSEGSVNSGLLPCACTQRHSGRRAWCSHRGREEAGRYKRQLRIRHPKAHPAHHFLQLSSTSYVPDLPQESPFQAQTVESWTVHGISDLNHIKNKYLRHHKNFSFSTKMKGEPGAWKTGQGLTRVWLETNLEINSQVVRSEGKVHIKVFFFF